jgi:hypothetical protein
MQDIIVTAPVTAKDQVEGAVRIICGHSDLKYVDPTVYYQQGPKSHLHDSTGNRAWYDGSNYGNLRAGGGSTCNNVAGYDGLNKPAPATDQKLAWAAWRTPYWQPALLDGKGNVILADTVQFYYKQRSLQDPVLAGWKPAGPGSVTGMAMGKGVTFPFGLKFIFGCFPDNPAKACEDGGPDFQAVVGGAIAYSGKSMKTAVDTVRARGGGQFVIRRNAPQCWNGKDLDSADHRSHMAYADYSNGYGYLQCPQTHQFVIPSFTYIASYTVLPTDDGNIRLSCDNDVDPNLAGKCWHADYGPAAPDPIIWNMAYNGCIQQLLNCNSGQIDATHQLKGGGAPIYNIGGTYQYSWTNPVRLVPIPPRPAPMDMTSH